MKTSKNYNRFKTCFQQQMISLAKQLILTFLTKAEIVFKTEISLFPSAPIWWIL